jgi:hypothetical protein
VCDKVSHLNSTGKHKMIKQAIAIWDLHFVCFRVRRGIYTNVHIFPASQLLEQTTF